MIFRNFREACIFYKFPGSHQVGSFGNKTGILRSYSNGTPGKDFFYDDEATVLYRLKDDKYRETCVKRQDGENIVEYETAETANIRGLASMFPSVDAPQSMDHIFT